VCGSVEASVFNIFKTKVRVEQGSPLTIEADGLIIPANDHLWMGAGFPGTVKKDGGEEIEVEAVRQGPAELGQAVPTSGGTLAFRRIYHAVLAGQDLKTHREQIRPAVGAALEAAASDGLECLAVAPLEDEELVGPFHEASQEVVAALLDRLGSATTLREVVLGVTREEGLEAYRKALLAGLSGG
jgi:O-acetyl-ADP-ribose deacetylase (regulator of RNase III)